MKYLSDISCYNYIKYSTTENTKKAIVNSFSAWSTTFQVSVHFCSYL